MRASERNPVIDRETLKGLYQVARRMGLSHSDACDLVHDACVQALQGMGNLRDPSRFRVWLAQILRRCASRLVQDRLAERHVVSLELVPEDQMPAFTQPGLTAVDAIDLQTAFRGIPHEIRRTVELVAVHGYTQEEAAAAEGCAVGTVKSRVSRAFSRIALRLAPSP